MNYCKIVLLWTCSSIRHYKFNESTVVIDQLLFNISISVIFVCSNEASALSKLKGLVNFSCQPYIFHWNVMYKEVVLYFPILNTCWHHSFQHFCTDSYEYLVKHRNRNNASKTKWRWSHDLTRNILYSYLKIINILHDYIKWIKIKINCGYVSFILISSHDNETMQYRHMCISQIKRNYRMIIYF